jgi:hypothetical protein
MKNEEALKKVGLDYGSFDEKELATIISKVMIKTKGITKNKFSKLVNNLDEESTDFTKKMVKYGKFSYDECDDMIKDVKSKKDSLKVDELKKAKEELATIQAKIKELEK